VNDRTLQRPDVVALADHLQRHREELLRAWHDSVETDPQITTVSTLARSQFIDHIPRILDAFDEQLRAHGIDDATAAEHVREGAVEHGIHRWLHGYHYRETMREWGHLQLCLSAQVEDFALSRPDLDSRAMSLGRQLLTRLFFECMVESAAGHVHLAETEAASRLRDLEQVLADVRALETERAELWHEAAHDLRGNVSAVQLAATALARSGQPAMRPAAAKIVERTARSMTVLLDDLVALARLEAGREQRQIITFDANATVREICRSFEPLAAERGLFLKWAAPALLPVDGDPVKVGRIVQNLLLNALKYTERGGVHVTLSAHRVGSVPSWTLRVEDTGVGIDDRASPAIAKLLRAATREAHVVVEQSGEADSKITPLPTASPQPRVAISARGEGVGLTIVKRLCELLDATIELDTAHGRGTTFLITFPRQYPPAAG
jgi:signal transduction histidine kinase